MGNNNCCQENNDKSNEIDLSNIKSYIKKNKKFKFNRSSSNYLKNKKYIKKNIKSKSLDIKINNYKKDIKTKNLKNIINSIHNNIFLKINPLVFKKFIQDNVKNFYTIIKQIGEGGFGTVFLVKHNETNILRAMKSILKSYE